MRFPQACLLQLSLLSAQHHLRTTFFDAAGLGKPQRTLCPPHTQHNDITGALQLTVDTDFNYRQISGFYTRLLRDEVTAEWRFDAPTPCLHIYCYVSGHERWLAPAQLRNYIFRREIPLVRGS